MNVFASAIIPTRERPDLLRRALTSLLRQEFQLWEAIVVDDGAGEGAGVAASFSDPRIRAIPCPGRGQVDARNAGIAHARGEIVCWLDDDDWWDDTRHLVGLRAAWEEGAAVLYRGGWIVASDGPGDDWPREPYDWSATADSLRQDNTILTSAIAYPRRAHRVVGMLDTALGGYCDWDILLRLTDAGLPLRRVPGRGVCYSVHPAGASARIDDGDRIANFARLCVKHGLDTQPANHATIHAERRAQRDLQASA